MGRTTYQQIDQGVPVYKENLKPGDLVFFDTYGKAPGHVGIYIGNGQFIDSGTGSKRGVRVSNLNDAYWAPKFYGARRIQN